MINETIKQIEARIQNTESLPQDRRDELLGLLATLKAETCELAKTHTEHAQSIVGFTQIATHEATRAEQDKQLIKLSSLGLRQSVEEFETSHPRLAQIVNNISTTLSNSGI